LVIGIRREAGRHARDSNIDIRIVTPSVTALGVEQARTPSVADPAGDRAELVIVSRDHAAAGEADAGGVAVQPAVLGLDADHAVGGELVVEAALPAAEERGVAAGEAVVAGEGATDMAANVEAGPVVDYRRGAIGGSLGVGARGHVGRHRRACEDGQSGSAK